MAKKWDDDSTSSEKLLLLSATLFFNNRTFSLRELSSPSCLNASKPTVSRLLEKLERCGIGELILEEKGRENYCRLARGQAPDLALDPSGVAMLAYAGIMCFISRLKISGRRRREHWRV
ncbi:MAG: hypothetical protein K2H64_03870 [Desulfovibrio sp.]|nr:hypothetical protein [Desulfovibrio sp.]